MIKKTINLFNYVQNIWDVYYGKIKAIWLKK